MIENICVSVQMNVKSIVTKSVLWINKIYLF